MKSELPYRRVFPADLLTDRDIARLSWHERGLLQAIEMRYWIDGDLSSDPDEVARLIGARELDLAAITKLLDSRFPIHGQIRRSASLDAEREAAMKLRDSYAERGKKGGHKGERKAELRAQRKADPNAEQEAGRAAGGKAVRNQSQSQSHTHNTETATAAAGAADAPPAPRRADSDDIRVRRVLDALPRDDQATIASAMQKSPLSGQMGKAIAAEVMAQLEKGNPRPADRSVEALTAMLMLGAKIVPGIFREFLLNGSELVTFDQRQPIARAM